MRTILALCTILALIFVVHASKEKTAMTTNPIQSENAPPGKVKQAMFGAGCFWGIEVAFRRLEGVVDAPVGYSGGHTENPTYQDVCTGETGHAEVVLVEYDPARISYGQLLDAFWQMHDPTTLNQQGPDIGTQYRSAIFYFDEEQKAAAEASRDRLQSSRPYRNRQVVTEITKAGPFWRAEEYHQRYLEKRGVEICH